MLLILFANLISSQILNEKYKSNTIYIEIVGQSVGLFSLNGDYRFHPNFTFRIGFGWAIFGYSVPTSINVITQAKKSHHLEVGLGPVYLEGASLFGGERSREIVLTGFLGYRYQPKDGGLVLRIGFTPWLDIDKSKVIDPGPRKEDIKYYYELFPVGGISIGYCFR